MPTPPNHHLQVTKPNAFSRLDKFIATAMPDISRTMAQKLIADGNVTRSNIIITNPTIIVKEHEIYHLTIPKPTPTAMLPADIPLKIIYEDDEFLVIDKPAGLTVHPGAGNHGDTMANALLAHCGESLSGIGGVSRPGIVHRLDKDTSGLIMAAKTDRAHQSLSSQIATRTLKRTYLALCWGVPHPMQGRIEANIGRSATNRKKMAVVKSGGKTAATNYKVIEILAGGAASLIECRLESGRTHQIRVHMTHIGHNIIGDKTYTLKQNQLSKNLADTAKNLLKTFPRQALHSHKVTLSHPKTGEEINFICQLAEDIVHLLTAIKHLTK